MDGKLNIIVWPLGENRKYIQVVNPMRLYDGPRYQLVSYENEDESSLKQIRDQAYTILDKEVDKPLSKTAGIWGPTALGIGAQLAENTVGSFIIQLYTDNITITLFSALLSTAAIWGTVYGLYRKIAKRYNEKVHDRNIFLYSFKLNPISELFKPEVDPILSEINKTIVLNEGALKIADSEIVAGVRQLLYHASNLMTPPAREVYNQIIAADEGTLIDPKMRNVERPHKILAAN